jgi:hypothetical protein
MPISEVQWKKAPKKPLCPLPFIGFSPAASRKFAGIQNLQDRRLPHKAGNLFSATDFQLIHTKIALFLSTRTLYHSVFLAVWFPHC